MGTTSVPQPTFGPTGFVAPAESDILEGVQADWQAAFGGGLVFTTTSGSETNPTPAGQITASEAAIIGDKNNQFLYYCSQVDPAYAAGRMQDGIARIYFITRNPAQPTVAEVACIGAADVIIAVGAQLTAADGNIYACTQAGTIPSTGTITLPFACTVTGPIACPAQTFKIYQTIPGWDTAISTADGVLGNVVESRSAFEARRSASVALNAQGSLPSVVGAILAVSGVLDAYVTENVTDDAVTIGGAALAPHSLYVAVAGGLATAIAQAIWTKKSPGCNTNGSVTVNVPDTSCGTPYPTYPISFVIPAATPIYFSVVIANSAAVPSDAAAQIQAAIISAFAGGDGGPRARIGSTIYASRFYAAVAKLGTWAQIVDIQIGLSPAALANSVVMQINQVPVAAAPDISLVLA